MSYLKNKVLEVEGYFVRETVARKIISRNEIKKAKEEKNFDTVLVWEGTEKDTECEKFKRYVENRYNLKLVSDKDFHRWSVDRLKDFWESVWDYFEIQVSKPYEEVFVRTGPGFLDYDWFTEARFNLAENLMRYRDETIALICEDEEGRVEHVTFEDLYEEVKLYSAAFRKHGLQKGGRVACHMSNRKEAILAMLATLSIGGLWSGIMPFVGAKYAANLVNIIEPKFLIVIDRYHINGEEHNVLDNLPTIVENASTLEKVIIVRTKDSNSTKSISHIKNSCFLQDFLENGKQDGTVPDIIFEQLPASHPVFLSFTSGTTSKPKGTVHSARVLISALTNVSFSYNLKKGDVLFNNIPMGWAPILGFSQALHIGVTIYLYQGYLAYEGSSLKVWDAILDERFSFLPVVPTQLDILEKMRVIPESTTSHEHLKVIGLGGCPVKTQNSKYLFRYLPKNIFAGNLYGATEAFGFFSGVYLKSPAYAGEAQLSALGIDLKCFSDEGLPVVGKLGTAVITSPYPGFPLYLWKDIDNTILDQSYLSRYPGVWCQDDVCWINPLTNGIRIKGRGDVTFIQNGDRFGPEDIYFAIHTMDEIEDYICVSQFTSDGGERVILFVKLKSGCELTPSLNNKIKDTILNELIEEWVPELVIAVKGIPYNVSNKRMESLVKKIVATNKIPEMLNVKNPECLLDYCNIPEIMNC